MYRFRQPEVGNGSRVGALPGRGALMVAVLGAMLAMGVQIRAATFTAFDHIDYAGSATDVLSNMYPHGPTTYREFYENLTDGAMQGDYTTVDIDTWTYAYDVPGSDTYVSRLDIWLSASDGSRDAYDFEILFSDDGSSYTSVIRSSHSPSGTASGKANLARFTFDPGETRGMSHVRIVCYGVLNTSNGFYYEPRVGEIDMHIVPEDRSYSITMTKGTNLNQSASDAINGLSPTVSSGFYTDSGALTDATSATEPTATTFHNSGYTVVTGRWDLGVLDGETFLDRVDIWLPPTDTNFRYPLRFRIVVSPDGSTWQEVAETGPRTGTDAPGNLVRIDFEPETVNNLRYIGVVDYPGAKDGRHGQIREIDVFLDDPPPRGSLCILK